MSELNERELVAPCGINCAVCLGYLREKNHCPGCRALGGHDSDYIVKCIIRNCETFKDGNAIYCYECERFPCRRMKQLDKRYSTRYQTSLFHNLNTIRDSGIGEFLNRERERWTCAVCGGTVCIHRGYCFSCGQKP